jgi:hypothetical protein
MPAHGRNAFERIDILVLIFERARHDHHVDVACSIITIDEMLELAKILNGQDLSHSRKGKERRAEIVPAGLSVRSLSRPKKNNAGSPH